MRFAASRRYPGNEPWEVYVVKADAGTLAKQGDSGRCAATTATATGVPVGAAASTCC